MASASFSWRIPTTAGPQTGICAANDQITLNEDWTLAVGYIRRWGGVLTVIVPAGTADPWADPSTPNVMMVAGDSRATPGGGTLTLDSVTL